MNEPEPTPRVPGLFRIIVAGSRTFTDYERLKAKLNHMVSRIGPETAIIIVSGKAIGADTLGERWAFEHLNALATKRGKHKGHVQNYYPQWEVHGKRAGILRNIEMAMYADALLAFWDGKSPGTKHMIDEAKRRGLKTVVVRF
jgi:hypothetical protein